MECRWRQTLIDLEQLLQDITLQIDQLDVAAATVDFLDAGLADNIRRQRNGMKRMLGRPLDFSGQTLVADLRFTKVNVQYRESLSATMNAAALGKTKLSPPLMGDILHSLYMPFCDLWRGDNHFCELLKQGKVQLANKIVRNLNDLPDRARAMLDS